MSFDTDLLVRRVVPITHDVTSFVFERPAGWAGRHDAGQHLTLSAGVRGEQVERCYTISSPPTRAETLSITVKRQPGGVFSPWLHEEVRPGDRIRARGPSGVFTTEEHPARAYLFLSAGSGITPAMSMTRMLADIGSDASVRFVHSARSPVDIIFRRELEALRETGLDLEVTVVCEADHPTDRWVGPKGRLSVDLLRWVAPDVTTREVFLCGPPGYMAATGHVLDALAVDPDRVHRESFSFGPTLLAFDGASDAGEFRIDLRSSGRTITCSADSTVLDAVLQAGVMLRSSCRQGLCGTCKLTLLGGEVDMRHQGGIRPREIERGSILPCCSRPLGDLVLEA